jgi:hypothetical protein
MRWILRIVFTALILAGSLLTTAAAEEPKCWRCTDCDGRHCCKEIKDTEYTEGWTSCQLTGWPGTYCTESGVSCGIAGQ